jgi:hypothetical protein
LVDKQGEIDQRLTPSLRRHIFRRDVPVSGAAKTVASPSAFDGYAAAMMPPEMQRKLFSLWRFPRPSGPFFGAGVEDVKRQNTTHDALDTTTSRNKKKPTKDLHQTYNAVFLSAMPVFRATQIVGPKGAPGLCARERYVAGQTRSSKAPLLGGR